jgi:alcohol dehydrogenase (cytochrome c)
MKLQAMLVAVLLLTGVTLAFPSSSESGPTQTELTAGSASTDWLLPNHDYAGQRFIDLKQVTRENAAQLRPICAYNSRDVARFAGSPLVYKGVMYLTTASSTIALDATNCTVRWCHDWKSKINAFQSRGLALKDGQLIRATSDGHLIALNMDDGDVLWDKAVADSDKSEYLIMAPLVFDDLVITGIGISEFRVKDG